jgi:hypothetical protein
MEARQGFRASSLHDGRRRGRVQIPAVSENAWVKLPDAAWHRHRLSGSLHSTSPSSGRSDFGRDDRGMGRKIW